MFGYIDVRRDGADAEYVAARAAELVPKPATLTHAQAAAVPLSALTAWQALFEQGELERGQRVLIHGGAGGVGSFAVQFARWRGAHVTATSSARDIELVRGLGADEVIDYRTQRFEDAVADQDLVFDTVGGETWERSWDVLRPGGRLVSIAVPRPPEREAGDGRRAIWFVVEPHPEQLREIGRLIDAGQVRPIVSAVLPLERGLEAYGSGRRSGGPGKVVLHRRRATAMNVDVVNGNRTAETSNARRQSAPTSRTCKAAGGTEMSTTAPTREPAVAANEIIRPFTVDIPQEAIDDLRRRLAATNWPEKETVPDQSQGVPLAMIQKLARYWATDYDWRTCEAKLNALPQFITEIDGLDIHFIHVRSRHDDALPLIVSHGWPGSIIEQLKIIDRLTDPTAHGGSAADAFHVVIPSMPGYGFSGKPTSTGWGPERMGRAWAELMQPPRLQPLCRPGRRLGCVRRRPDGPAGTCGITRHPHQHAGHRSGGRQRSRPGRRPAASRPVGRGTTRLRAADQDLQAGRVRADDGHASADVVRHRGFTGRPCRLAARPQRCRRPAGRGRRRGPGSDHERHRRTDP